MSVSDPLLKILKGFILEFRLKDEGNPIADGHRCLESFCESLECILRKGITTSHSIFGLSKRDYWQWIQSLNKNSNNRRIPPRLSLVIDEVTKCKKTTTSQGRGRLFIRQALQKKVFSLCIDFLRSSPEILLQWYDPQHSILGNEILCEIFMSLLYQLKEVNFSFDCKNCSFLDDTWSLPVYRCHQLVPCSKLGITVQSIDGRPFVIAIEPGGVVDDDGVLEVGDMLDEVLCVETRALSIHQVVQMLRQNKGAPIQLGIVKCKLADDSLFPHMIHLLRTGGRDYHSLKQVLDHNDERQKQHTHGPPPPHAVLPEDDLEQVPVHSELDKAIYKLKYVTKVDTKQCGGVDQVEHVIGSAMQQVKPEASIQTLQNVILELGETQVIVTDEASGDEILRQSYTEISSCGRRTDYLLYFCFIVGDTTCTLSKKFVAHVFRAAYDSESKTILCAIAQGFDRTHWFV